MKTLSVIGLGRLGLPLAACLAQVGYQVIGVEINPSVREAAGKGRSTFYEPGLNELMSKTKNRFSATDNLKAAVKNSEITFIVLPTPLEKDKGFLTSHIEEVATEIAEVIKSKVSFHLVVITSTVLPGATERIIRPILEKESGKKCGRDFGLCYNPEFIALGSVIKGLVSPQTVLIGESDAKSGDLLSDIYSVLCDNDPPIVRTTFYNAEIAKLALNLFVTTKISLVNAVAEMCELLPGGNVDVVTGFLGLDSRVGQGCLSGGLGFGGRCFPRDNQAFVDLARQLDLRPWIQEATLRVNDHQAERIVDFIQKKIGTLEDRPVAILGLTYKPDTDIVEESSSLEITKRLQKRGAKMKIYDPAGSDSASRILGNKNIVYAPSAIECLMGTELCLLATPWPDFKRLTPEDFIRHMKSPVLLDCWRLFDRQKFAAKIDYWALGLGPANR